MFDRLDHKIDDRGVPSIVKINIRNCDQDKAHSSKTFPDEIMIPDVRN